MGSQVIALEAVHVYLERFYNRCLGDIGMVERLFNIFEILKYVK